MSSSDLECETTFKGPQVYETFEPLDSALVAALYPIRSSPPARRCVPASTSWGDHGNLIWGRRTADRREILFLACSGSSDKTSTHLRHLEKYKGNILKHLEKKNHQTRKIHHNGRATHWYEEVGCRTQTHGPQSHRRRKEARRHDQNSSVQETCRHDIRKEACPYNSVEEVRYACSQETCWLAARRREKGRPAYAEKRPDATK